MAEHFDTLETRDPEVREHARLCAPAAADRARQGERAGLRAHPRGHRSGGGDHARRAGAGCRSRANRSSSSCRRRAGRSAVSRRRSGGGVSRALRACSRRPDRSTSRKAGVADYWRLARALFAAGFRPGRPRPQLFRVSLHAGRLDARNRRARARAAPCFPAAPARPSSRCRRWPNLQPAGYVGTPSFLKIILEKADEMGVQPPSLTKALVSAEPFPPSLRDAFLARGDRRLSGLRVGGPRQHRVSKPKRAKGSSSTRACWSKSCVRAPAIRSRPAKSARSS